MTSAMGTFVALQALEDPARPLDCVGGSRCAAVGGLGTAPCFKLRQPPKTRDEASTPSPAPSDNENMFWLHHPQSVKPRKPVAELSVSRFAAAPVNTGLIVIDPPG